MTHLYRRNLDERVEFSRRSPFPDTCNAKSGKGAVKKADETFSDKIINKN